MRLVVNEKNHHLYLHEYDEIVDVIEQRYRADVVVAVKFEELPW